MAQYGIGEFSRVTGLSVKTLRFYHDKGLLVPSYVDGGSGYRFYDHAQIERARIIASLKNMSLSLGQIKEILEGYDDQADLLGFFEGHKREIEARIREYRKTAASLDRIIRDEREAMNLVKESAFRVEEKQIDGMLIAAVRITGKYSECGSAFGRIARDFGRHICGKPLCLYYDQEYRPDDATFEACIPVRKAKEVSGVAIRRLASARCVCLLHKGPYEQLGRSYTRILDYTKANGFEIVSPTREVYIKGPGVILRGNPRRYLTEIQLPVKSEERV